MPKLWFCAHWLREGKEVQNFKYNYCAAFLFPHWKFKAKVLL